jgi:hypothetical protein
MTPTFITLAVGLGAFPPDVGDVFAVLFELLPHAAGSIEAATASTNACFRWRDRIPLIAVPPWILIGL